MWKITDSIVFNLQVLQVICVEKTDDGESLVTFQNEKTMFRKRIEKPIDYVLYSLQAYQKQKEEAESKESK